jgi:hypothetical protein
VNSTSTNLRKQKISPALNKLTQRKHNSKLFLHFKWYLPIMPVNFLPQTKGFFPHDFTLIDSVVGESVIGHGIGRKHIPAKMA